MAVEEELGGSVANKHGCGLPSERYLGRQGGLGLCLCKGLGSNMQLHILRVKGGQCKFGYLSKRERERHQDDNLSVPSTKTISYQIILRNKTERAYSCGVHQSKVKVVWASVCTDLQDCSPSLSCSSTRRHSSMESKLANLFSSRGRSTGGLKMYIC